MSEYAIDVSPLCIDHGELVLSEGSSVISDDLLAWLRERRIAAVVWPAAREAVLFAIAHDADGAVQLVDKDGSLTDGMLFADLRTELSNAGFGIDIALTCDLIDPKSTADSERDDAEVEFELPDDFGRGTVYALTEDGLTAVEDLEWPEEPRSQIWEFSHRGPSYAEMDALINRHPITVSVCDGWSAFGYREPEKPRTDLPPGRNELPLITAYLVDATDDHVGPLGWVDVKTKTRNLFGGYYLTLQREAPATFPAAEGEAGRLLAAMANNALDPDSEENAIIADDTIAVDAAGLQAAVAPAVADPHERLAMLLRALGVPAELIEHTIVGKSSGNQLLVEPRSPLSHLIAIADGGMRGITRLDRELNALERAADWGLDRPALGLGAAIANAGLGLAWLRASLRSRGTKRTLGLIGSLLVVSGATADAVLAARRLRRAPRNSG
ncbi:MAG TPA: hypothetical protein PKE40_15505 [Arachnia sp.]|nr:hypothetical protein [Arachnia sp.]HMT87748.1 hypothetical protein [Arachnia sp.]